MQQNHAQQPNRMEYITHPERHDILITRVPRRISNGLMTVVKRLAISGRNA